ncbi:unnamed protein product [Mycena citricolor]|uniref:Ubiquitin-like protease family profile domain-containing protein n=1 Tax=Mycena citricolor TaxID=2018698 RepID=A0AAD2GSN3_9AGAR|nr:unnamed protein product [Mycena citricolor]
MSESSAFVRENGQNKQENAPPHCRDKDLFAVFFADSLPMHAAIEKDVSGYVTAFDPSCWINCGRIYKDVPPNVAAACVAARALPDAYAILPPDCSVRQLLAQRMPHVLSPAIAARTTWLLRELPNCGHEQVTGLASIPPLSVVRTLQNAFGQSWFDGYKSVQDPVEKSRYLPLYAISAFWEMHELLDAKAKWQRSYDWMPVNDRALLGHVGWNTQHAGAPEGQLDWTRLLSKDGWISGLIIDEMIYVIVQKQKEGSYEPETCVLDLSFQRNINAFADPTHRGKHKHIRQLAEKIKNGDISRVLCPLHLNGNHWIAFEIDFKRSQLLFGDSLNSRSGPTQFAANVRQWIWAQISETFPNLPLQTMLHGTQDGFNDCGIYTADTIEHALFSSPLLLDPVDCPRARVTWFKRFVHSRDASVLPLPSETAQTELLADSSELEWENAPVTAIPPPDQVRTSITLIDLLNPPSSPGNPSLSHGNDPVAQDHNTASDTVPKSEPDPIIVPPCKPPPLSISPVKTKHSKPAQPATVSDESDGYLTDDCRASQRPRKPKTQPRAAKQTEKERINILLQDKHTVKQGGKLKGTAHTVYCRCRPNTPIVLDKVKTYALAHWISHQKRCELVTGQKKGTRVGGVQSKTVKSVNPQAGSLLSFVTVKKRAAVRDTDANVNNTKLVTVKAADHRLDVTFFTPLSTDAPLPAPVPLHPLRQQECIGLCGPGHREYAFQMGDNTAAGLDAKEWNRLARELFPYKQWDGHDPDSGAETSDLVAGKEDHVPAPVAPGRERMGSFEDLTKRALSGIDVTTNRHPARSAWTQYEVGRLHQACVAASRWRVSGTAGAVFSKRCTGATWNRDGVCSECVEISKAEGLKRGVRKALKTAALPPAEFANAIERRLKYTPVTRSDHTAATTELNLKSRAVVKILTAKAQYGDAGVFLTLYQQAQRGELAKRETFIAMAGHMSDRTRREQDPTGKLIHGIRYPPLVLNYCTLMRSYGHRSGAQYDLFSTFSGGPSKRQLRRNAAKYPVTLRTSELCRENLDSVVAYSKLIGYTGPWIAAGDGTKLRPVLSVSAEFSDKGSAHVVGSTLPLKDVQFSSSEEQSQVTDAIEKAEAIATQVWVLALKIPLPNMPVFPVAFVPNKGDMTAGDVHGIYVQLRSLCAEAGIKLLATGSDGAKAEVNAQQMLMNEDTPKRLSCTNKKYGIFLSCPVHNDTGPLISNTDPDHALKTTRNNLLTGTHLLILGGLYICHSVLMTLLSLKGTVLYRKDIFNTDKQDDGAARRMFTASLLRILVNEEGDLVKMSLGGLFMFLFVFGELFDAWTQRKMTHIQRLVCVFRARHFMNIWRISVFSASDRYPNFFPPQQSFIADSSFQILIRLCDQFVLLLLAHLEYYPDVPFMPWHHGTHYLEHFYGIAWSFVPEFSQGQLVEMYKHICIRQHILSTGQYTTKKEKDSNNGYTFDYVDANMTTAEIKMLKEIPSREQIDEACAVAWHEAAEIARQLGNMPIPSLPLSSSSLHPHFRTAPGPEHGSTSEESLDEEEEDDGGLGSIIESPIAQPNSTDCIRIPFTTPSSKPTHNVNSLNNITEADAQGLAAHHVLTEDYLGELASQSQAVLDTIHDDLESHPESKKTMSGRMLIANLLNPLPFSAESPEHSVDVPSFLPSNGVVSRKDMLNERLRHSFDTRVHSEATRKPQINEKYLDGKFSLNHAMHQLKETIENSDRLRKDTEFHKGRYRRWIASGSAETWDVGRALKAIFTGTIDVPNIDCRGVSMPDSRLLLGSLVMMRSPDGVYLGEVLAIYRYGSVSGKHESFPEAETTQGLSYLSLKVYNPIPASGQRNIFEHIAAEEGATRPALPLFTHAYASDLIYNLKDARLTSHGDEAGTYSLSAGDNVFERWRYLAQWEHQEKMKLKESGGARQKKRKRDVEGDISSKSKAKKKKTSPTPRKQPQRPRKAPTARKRR